MFAVFAIAAVCLSPPVDGPVNAGYAPVGQYGGHWGADYAAAFGEAIKAPVSGRVTFAGSVAGMRTLTIEPVPGFKVSLSYLSSVDVAAGVYIRRGSLVGTAGSPHGIAGVHLSTRSGGQYTDPALQMDCRDTDISRALRLITPPQPYARRRAYGNLRRDLRPDSYRPSPRRRFCPRPTGSRSGAHRSGR